MGPINSQINLHIHQSDDPLVRCLISRTIIAGQQFLYKKFFKLLATFGIVVQASLVLTFVFKRIFYYVKTECAVTKYP